MLDRLSITYGIECFEKSTEPDGKDTVFECNGNIVFRMSP